MAFPESFLATIGWEVIDYLIDFLFFIDILISFRTTFFDKHGEEITEPKKIALHYLKGRLWIDLLTISNVDKINPDNFIL
jgi:hypothetical protein